MTDPIETRLYDYFSQLRPNPALPTEVRLVAALDRAAAKPVAVPFLSRSRSRVLRGGAQRIALLATAAIVIAAVAGTYGLSTIRSGPGVTSPSPSADASPSPSAAASATQSPTRSAPPSPAAILTQGPTEPPGPSSFKPASGRMTEWRDGAVAALLLDGRVLIVGGNGGGEDRDMASAELFDPKTNTFSVTGSMYQKHGRQATATLLLDGRVLVVGGADTTGTQISSDAELYDPATGKFSETGQTTEPTWYHTATRLPDGRVLIIRADDLSQGAHAQIYDPATGKFTQGTAMTTVTMPEVTALLADGRVLIVGAQANSSGGAGPAAAELYEPASGTFSPTGRPVSAPFEVVGTALADGRVCIASNGLIQIYDPATGKFAKAASLTYAPRPHNVFALPDGRVLVTYYNQTNPAPRTLSATIFNPATGKTSLSGKMVEYRAEFTDTLLLDGRVLVAGGALIYLDHNVGELFDPSTDTFRATGP